MGYLATWFFFFLIYFQRRAKRDADAKSEKAVLLRTYLHITFEQNSVLGSSFDNNIHLGSYYVNYSNI